MASKMPGNSLFGVFIRIYLRSLLFQGRRTIGLANAQLFIFSMKLSTLVGLPA